MNHLAYPAYKESGVPWLGKVPDHWEVKASRYGFEIQLGKMLQPEASTISDREVPYLKSQHVQWESVCVTDLPNMWASDSDIKKYRVRDGDLLVCEGGDVGRSGVVRNPPKEAIIQNALHRVRSESNNLGFLLFVLEHAASQNWFEILCNRSTIAHFTGEKFNALQIAFPPLSEQTAIADFLDRETGRIDALVAKKRRLIELLREKRSALISRTVTRGLPADAAREFGLEPHTRFKDSGIEWLGEVPDGWEVWKVSHGFKNTGSGTTPPSDNDEWYDGNIPWVTTSELRENIITDTSKKISEETIKTFSALKLFPEGSLLIAMYGATIGRLGILGVAATTNQACCALFGDHSLTSRFMFHWFQAFKDQVIILASGGGQPNISQEKIRSIRLACPSVSEQKAIATYLDRETAKIDRLIDKVEEAVERLQEYRTALITAAVTGKIDVRGRVEEYGRTGTETE